MSYRWVNALAAVLNSLEAAPSQPNEELAAKFRAESRGQRGRQAREHTRLLGAMRVDARQVGAGVLPGERQRPSAFCPRDDGNRSGRDQGIPGGEQMSDDYEPDEASFLIYEEGHCCFCGAALRSREMFAGCDDAEIYCPDCGYVECIE